MVLCLFSSGTFGGIFLGEMGSFFLKFNLLINLCWRFFFQKMKKKTEIFVMLGIFWDHISK